MKRRRSPGLRRPTRSKSTGETAIPLGVRNAAVHVETSRRVIPAAIRDARFHRDAERLDLSNPVSVDFAGDGFDVDYMLVSTAFDRWQQPTGYSSTNFSRCLFYYALFLAIDWTTAGFAFVLERKERWRLLWWLFLQRFCYRQVMYYVMIKSVAMAIRGPVVGWGKLERKATAEAQP